MSKYRIVEVTTEKDKYYIVQNHIILWEWRQCYEYTKGIKNYLRFNDLEDAKAWIDNKRKKFKKTKIIKY